ncbi:FtsB family cell division protein [Nocardia jiangxiensis]|uniref:Septum formation initiator family protein n=1 Tax=Nocardia jiangxiensis TaxID=282685 RepID=A0ABW6RSB1_9NOCA|nr:septum formation initiator family protein [Nocardia jiangxiensis]
MTERRARGTSPGGRGDRRSSRSAHSRPERNVSTPPARTAAGKRPVQRRTSGSRSESGLAAQNSSRRTAARKAKDRREHRFLGLSTGRAVLLAAVLCALALTLAVPMRTYLSQRAEATQLAQQRRDLEDNVARLRDRRAQQQDPAYIKSEARERLRLVMPGDTAYVVQVPGIEQPAVPTPTAAPRKLDPWYTELWRSMNNPQPVPAAAPQTGTPPPSTPEGHPR